MPVPTTYTESTLAVYMNAVLGQIATYLQFTGNATTYELPITDTLIAYGVADIALATDARKLRAIAKREAWRFAMEMTAVDYDIDMDDQGMKRSQIHAQAVSMYNMAAAQAAPYTTDDPSYSAQIYAIADPDDPYRGITADVGGV